MLDRLAVVFDNFSISPDANISGLVDGYLKAIINFQKLAKDFPNYGNLRLEVTNASTLVNIFRTELPSLSLANLQFHFSDEKKIKNRLMQMSEAERENLFFAERLLKSIAFELRQTAKADKAKFGTLNERYFTFEGFINTMHEKTSNNL